MQDHNDASMEYAQLLRENVLLKESIENAWNTSAIYSHIAYALARDYTDLFYVNVDTGAYIEFHSDDSCGRLLESRRATDFFESCKREARVFVHPDDQDLFMSAMDRDFLLEALAHTEEFQMVYRRSKGGRTFYVQMNVSRMKDNDGFLVMAVKDVDELVKKRRAEERIREERLVYARLHAITGNFIVVYVVDPETGVYHEFSSTPDYREVLAQPQAGEDFFGDVWEAALRFNHPDDLPRFFAAFTRENVLATIERSGIFSLGYRFLMGDRFIHVQMKAAMVTEDEGQRLIVGLNDIDAQVRLEEETERRLAQAQEQANIDALTGVKNRHAYLEAEERLNGQIARLQSPPFAIVVLDVNDLKTVNDSAGHQAGDEHLRSACKVVCDVFKHSPVFRVGGDEFAVIAQGEDYSGIEGRLADLRRHNHEATDSGGVVIACGMAKFDDDGCVAEVFNRADRLMYVDKDVLKARKAEQEGQRG